MTNTTPIRAIPTRYAGRLFRSRTEARWAVFFDELGVEWEYEVQGFETSHGRYLPDFYLPKLGVMGADPGTWFEVKNDDYLCNAPEDEWPKWEEVILGTRKPLVAAFGMTPQWERVIQLDHTQRWNAAMGCTQRVLDAAPGACKDTLTRETAGAIRAGCIEPEKVQAIMLDAAQSIGLSADEAQHIIGSVMQSLDGHTLEYYLDFSKGDTLRAQRLCEDQQTSNGAKGEFFAYEDGPVMFCVCDICGNVGVEWCGCGNRVCEHGGGIPGDDTGAGLFHDRVIWAYEAALSARFEFGDSGSMMPARGHRAP